MRRSAKLLLTLPAVFVAHAGLSILIVLCLLSSIRHGAAPSESPWFIPGLLLCPIMPLAFFADYLLSETQFVVVIAVTSIVYSLVLTWAGSAIGRKVARRRNAKPNQALHATSEPAPGAVSSSHEG